MTKDILTLEANARDAVHHRRFKDAIVAYKNLLKHERRLDWESGLAEAYLQRAIQVAAKGMYQEAIILWENLTALRTGVAPSEDYLTWLVQAKQFNKLAQILATIKEPMAGNATERRLTEMLALMALENQSLLRPFPVAHPIIRHQPTMIQAVRAYCEHRDGDVEEYLKTIPSRSPYRNMRTVLKALVVFDNDRDAACALLARIEADSLCCGLAHTLQRYRHGVAADLDGYFDLAPKQHALLSALNGYGKERIKLITQLRNAMKSGSAQTVLETIVHHRNEFGDAASRRHAFTALLSYPAGIPLYERTFGNLTPFDIHRIRALHQEQTGDHAAASDQWNSCLHAINGDPLNKQRSSLQSALVLRRMAMLALRDNVTNLAASWLEESLVTDPDDKPTYLSLLKLYDDLDDVNSAQIWLDKALVHFPQDQDVLILAMQKADQRNAFKKAAGYAKSLLEIDPINSQARTFLLDAHLGSARKQMKSGRYDLAQQELAQARLLDPHHRIAARCFLDALVAYQQGGADACRPILREGFAAAGGDLAARVILAIESLSAGLPQSGALALVDDFEKDSIADRQQLLVLIKGLRRYQKANRQNLSAAIRPFFPTLKKSFKHAELSEEDYFNLCQSFAEVTQYDLVKECAAQGLRRTPLAPGLVYFQIYAKCNGNAFRISVLDQSRLDTSLEHARESGNKRAEVLIFSLLRKFSELHAFEAESSPFSMPGPMADIDPDDLNQALEVIMEVERWSRKQLIAYLAPDLPAANLKSMPHEQLLAMTLIQRMCELGINPNLLANVLPVDKPAKKARFR